MPAAHRLGNSLRPSARWRGRIVDGDDKPRLIGADPKPGLHIGAGERDRSIQLRFDDLEATVVGGLLQLDFPGRFTTIRGDAAPKPGSGLWPRTGIAAATKQQVSITADSGAESV